MNSHSADTRKSLVDMWTVGMCDNMVCEGNRSGTKVTNKSFAAIALSLCFAPPIMYLGLVRQAEKKGRIQSVIEHLKLLKQEKYMLLFKLDLDIATQMSKLLFSNSIFSFWLLCNIWYMRCRISNKLSFPKQDDTFFKSWERSLFRKKSGL